MRRTLARRLFASTQDGIFNTSDLGTWKNPMRLRGSAGLYAWYDATNDRYRCKSGSAPTSETDGYVVSMGV